MKKVKDEFKEETALIFTEDSKNSKKLTTVTINNVAAQNPENDLQKQSFEIISEDDYSTEEEETKTALKALRDDIKSPDGKTNLLAGLLMSKNAKDSESNVSQSKESENNESETERSNSSEDIDNESSDQEIKNIVMVKTIQNVKKNSQESIKRNQITSGLDGSIIASSSDISTSSDSDSD